MTMRPFWIARALLRPPALWLAVLVVAWWLVIVGSVMLLLPPPALAGSPASRLGLRARVAYPERQRWPIPTSRPVFDQFRQAVADGDEYAIIAAFGAGEWIEADQGQVVQIVTIDGEAVEIELPEGSYASRRGWIAHSLLTVP